jgi:hypothetical protein
MSENQTSQEQSSKALVDALNKTSEFRHQNLLLSIVEQVSSTLESKVADRAKYYNELQKIRNNYIVNGIYDVVSNDVFVSSGYNDYIKIEVPNDPDLQQELIDLFDDLNIADMIASIFPELLHHGSYPLKPILDDEEGLVGLVDEYHPSEVIAVTSLDNFPLFYFISEGRHGSAPDNYGWVDYSKRVKFNYASITEIVYFSLDLEHIKLELPTKVLTQFKSKLPEDLKTIITSGFKVKQSKSFVWGAVDKIKETLLMEKVGLYKNMASVLSPKIVGVPVPDIYDPNNLIAIVKKYDELINGGTAKLNSLDNPEFTLQDIANVKVIPIAGDRAVPSPIDTGSEDRTVDTEALDRSLEKTLNTLSVPTDVFLGEKSSKDNLKSNIRYAKKIKRIQKNIAKTLVNLCLLHISKRYPEKEVAFSDIKIQLKNNINTDELENLESQDLIISSTNAIKELFDNLASFLGPDAAYKIDVNSFAENVKNSLASIGSQYSNSIVKVSGDSDEKPEVKEFVPATSEDAPDQ